MSLYSEILRRAESQPEALCYSSGDVELSYGALVSATEKLQGEMHRFGVKAGALLSFVVPSGPDFLVCLLASLGARLIVSPVATELVPAEQERVFAALQPQFLLGPSADLYSAGEQQDCCSVEIGQTQYQLRRYTPRVSEETSQVLKQVCPNGGCIRFTSGTTAAAKGVLISAESALARVQAATDYFALAPGERVLTLLAMPYHFVVSLLEFLRAGACIVRPKNSSPRQLTHCFEQEGCHVLYAAPFHFDLLVGSAKSVAPELRLAISTSTKLRASTASRFLEKFGLSISDSYGIIEVGLPIGSSCRHSQADVLGSARAPYEVAVLEGAELKRKGSGILLVRGPGMFDAYLSPVSLREEVLRDGWFETGDLAEILESGEVRLLGRSNSAIHIAGFKVFPEEVEAVLLAHEAVKEVQVEGVAHPGFGSTIHANVVLENDNVKSSELQQHCRAELGAIKTPHTIELVSSLKKTATGKLIRKR